jgi:Putative Zn-dependent protease, contains TPR repeats
MHNSPSKLLAFSSISLKALIFALIFSVVGCSTNSVTGESQLSLVPKAQQIQMGEQNYGPSQQQQGGEYKVDPNLSAYVTSVGDRLAAFSTNALPYEFVVLNNDVPNAWALPGGKIAINRGLLVLLDDEAQLAAVLGHEIIHAAAEHGATQMTNAQLIGAGLALGTIALGDNQNAQLIGAGAAIGAQAYQAHYGRTQELQSDFYGMDLMVKAGYEPQAAVELQETFVKLSQGQSSDMVNRLFASHPPSQERVDKNRAKAAKLASGKRNRSEFQKAIAQIKRDLPAYEKNQQALQALAKKDFNSALQLTEQALKQQGDEALFYITKGQILAAQKDTKNAELAFKRAVEKNPNYFMGYLGLGLTQFSANNHSAAKSSLERSLNLMPTQIAVYRMGQIEEGAGNLTTALKYYEYAAASGGDIGAEAQAKLQKLQSAPAAN